MSDHPFVIFIAGSLSAAVPLSFGIKLLANASTPIDNAYGAIALMFATLIVMSGAAAAALGAIRRGWTRI